LKYQECCERLRALPLKAMECEAFSATDNSFVFNDHLCDTLYVTNGVSLLQPRQLS
jgi:hypothetical protein